MAGRGGARSGAGRKAKPVVPTAVGKGVANEILFFLALPKSGHPKKCRCLMCRWRTLSEAMDLRLRFQVEKSLLDRTIGLPAQAIDMNLSGEIDSKIYVTVDL